MVNIAVLVSGGGTNLQALIDADRRGAIRGGRLALVVSSREDAFALTRAEAAGITREVLRPCDFGSRQAYSEAMAGLLESRGIGLVVLAGFMYILSPSFCSAFSGRMMNVHPALIPSFCGEGFYGLRVHRAALECGVKLSGATVHFVTDVTDGGPIILQKAVPVEEDDTPETLQKRIMVECEQVILPRAVSLFCEGRLRLEGRRVSILEEGKGCI